MRLFLFFTLFLFQHVQAQSVLRFQHINVEDGLSQSSANSVFQDSHGFIWIATGDGINRYDGKLFNIYKSRLSDSLPGPVQGRNINSRLFEDKYNRIWFASDAGISFMDTHTGKFSVVLDKYTTACAGVLHGIDTAAWLSIPHAGVYCINVSTLKKTLYPFTDRYQASADINIIKDGAASADELWMLDKAGLMRFDKRTKKEERKLVNSRLNAVCLLHTGMLLLTTFNGICLYDTKAGSAEFVELKTGEIMADAGWGACVEDKVTGTVYLASLHGGYICKLNLETRKHELLSIKGNTITGLFIDSSENLWIGTDGSGVYKLDIKHPKFFCFRPGAIYGATEQNDFMVKSIYHDAAGKIWMGVFNNGIITYDPATRMQDKIALGTPCDNQLISAIIKDSAGNIVVAIGDKIIWLDPVSHKELHRATLPCLPYLSRVKPTIYALTEWKSGHYLAGGNLGMYAVVLANNKARAWIPASFYNDSLITAWPYNFYSAGGNTLYIGLRRGFVKLSMVSDSQYHMLDHGFRDVPVRHFYKSAGQPVLWLASEQGLIAYNETTKHYTILDERAGLANSFIYAILPQSDTSLWVSTNNGLANVLLQYGGDANITSRVVNYSVKDGLQSNEFNTGAYYKDGNGIMYFGGIAGINWFDPAHIPANVFKARPAISGIYINDSLYAGDTAIYVQQMSLPYNRNTVSLTLSALEFTRAGQNVFSYMLDGVDKDWVSTTDDIVRYANLPPGTYHFLLRVSNNDGVWSGTPLQLAITILPPWWLSWWFMSLLSLLSVLLIYAAVRYYVQQKLKVKTRALEKQQALYLERLRISKDVHDGLGSGLSKISLIAALAQNKALIGTSVSNDIGHISAVSRELVDNMRDLIWVLNPEHTTLEQLVCHLREYCAEYLEHIPITATLSFTENVPDMHLPGEVQRNIFLAVKEAVNNCIKHSGADALCISLIIEAGIMCIELTDDGKGFDANLQSGSGNGLRNMAQRIASVGGTFTITSVPNVATRIHIGVPLAHWQNHKIPL